MHPYRTCYLLTCLLFLKTLGMIDPASFSRVL